MLRGQNLRWIAFTVWFFAHQENRNGKGGGIILEGRELRLWSRPLLVAFAMQPASKMLFTVAVGVLVAGVHNRGSPRQRDRGRGEPFPTIHQSLRWTPSGGDFALRLRLFSAWAVAFAIGVVESLGKDAFGESLVECVGHFLRFDHGI